MGALLSGVVRVMGRSAAPVKAVCLDREAESRDHGAVAQAGRPMSDLVTTPKTTTRVRTERPKLYKVILLNDDFTPRDFVVKVLKAVFRMGEGEALGVMLTAHRRGACVVAVFTKEVAETKATMGTDMGRRAGYPLAFTTEREE
jgi:ATP-dependent Clp protease adaptor protein ClpS